MTMLTRSSDRIFNPMRYAGNKFMHEIYISFSFTNNIYNLMVVVDVNSLKNGRKPVKLQKESPAGCAGDKEVVRIEMATGRISLEI